MCKKAAACQWRIGSFQSTIDDRGQVDGAVARVHARFHPAVEPGQRLGQAAGFRSLRYETTSRRTCRRRGLTAVQTATPDRAAFRRSGAWQMHRCASINGVRVVPFVDRDELPRHFTRRSMLGSPWWRSIRHAGRRLPRSPATTAGPVEHRLSPICATSITCSNLARLSRLPPPERRP